jgi:hypothetical protein
MTAFEAGLCCSTSGGPPCSGISAGGTSPGAGASSSSGTRRSTDWIVSAPALEPTFCILRVEISSYHRLSTAVILWVSPILCIERLAEPRRHIIYVMSGAHISYDGIMPLFFDSDPHVPSEFCLLLKDEGRASSRGSLPANSPHMVSTLSGLFWD